MGESIIFDFGDISKRLPKEEIIKPKPVILSPRPDYSGHPMVYLDPSALRWITVRENGGQRLVVPNDFFWGNGLRMITFNGSTFELV